MNRGFVTHEIRRESTLCGLWSLSADGRSLTAYVPSCLESIPGLETYRGEGVYSRWIETDSVCNLRFVFLGVSFDARVYLDDVLLGRHEDAYTAFAFVAPGVQPGRHRLSVRVDNRFGEHAALHVPNDYMSYGGITRACHVQTVPDVFIRSLSALPRADQGAWLLHLSVKLQPISGQPHDLTVTVHAAGQTVALHGRIAAQELTLEHTLRVEHADEWSPQSPTLYSVRAVLCVDGSAVDDLTERVGFRSVQASPSRVLLNGSPLRIAGVNRHEDMANFGCAIPAAAMLHDLTLIRDLGFNAVRTSHYPNDPLFLDYCDELGLLVWEEGHARGLSLEQMQNPHFLAQSRASLSEMITQHINHPCVIFWGLLNECASDTPYGRTCYERLLGVMRSLDDTRLMVSASCKRGRGWGLPPAMVSSEAGDLCHDLQDAVCHNIYPEWYLSVDTAAMLRDLYQGVQNAGGAGKPFIISEIGAGALYGNHDPRRAKWSEERQSDILRSQISALLADEHVAGFFIWQFCDNRVTQEGGWFRDRARTMNNKGIVDEYRRPKMAYAAVREALTALKYTEK